MKVKITHAPYIAKKVTIDLINNKHIEILQPKENIEQRTRELLEIEITKEMRLEEAVDNMLDNVEDEVYDEFEYMDINYKQVFWMAKKKLAKSYNVILNLEDRFNNLSHEIIEELFKKDLINYQISENKIKNIVFDAIMNFIRSFDEVEKGVLQRITHYKRELIPGTEDYNLVYQKLYEEELIRKGLA